MSKTNELPMPYRDLSLEQAKQMIEAEQAWSAHEDAVARAATFAGTMSWSNVNGIEYLVRQTPSGTANVRNKTGFGRRSPETEAIFDAFVRGKAATKERLDSAKSIIDNHARINKALRLGRVPSVVAKVCREFDRAGLLGKSVSILGTNVLYAYEAKAGVIIDNGEMSTSDLDLFFDGRNQLRLAATAGLTRSFIKLLKQADPSFEPTSPGSFRAFNNKSYAVEFIKAPVGDMLKDTSPTNLGALEDMQAVGIDKLKWLAAAQKISVIAIAEDGYPVRMVVPDPRAFVIYKHWLGTAAIDREPVKRRRDLAQAKTVTTLTEERFLDFPFDSRALRHFPIDLINKFMEWRKTWRQTNAPIM